MGCDAITLGSKDFGSGLEKLKALEDEADFPFISANIQDSFGANIFESYKIIRKNDINLGVIGLSSVFLNDELRVSDPLPILESLVDEVASKSDFVVLLFHANDQDITSVKNSGLDIDLIIQSKTTRRSNDGGGARIPVFSCGDRGKLVYRFEVEISNDSEKITDLSKLDREIATLDRQLRKATRNNASVEFDLSIPSEKRKFDEVERLKTRIRLVNEKIETTQNYIKFEKIELGKTVVDEPEILMIVDEGKRALETLSSPQPAIPFNRRQ